MDNLPIFYYRAGTYVYVYTYCISLTYLCYLVFLFDLLGIHDMYVYTTYVYVFIYIYVYTYAMYKQWQPSLRIEIRGYRRTAQRGGQDGPRKESPRHAAIHDMV